MCVAVAHAMIPCPGDTRSDRKCNHDSTHRVCAMIGMKDTSFWEYTGQTSWCNTVASVYDGYSGEFAKKRRCPEDHPSWCICKWATARWIDGEGCNDRVQFNCAATDVCDLKLSYLDFNVNLKPAHDCLSIKCKAEWDACPDPPTRPPTTTAEEKEESGPEPATEEEEEEAGINPAPEEEEEAGPEPTTEEEEEEEVGTTPAPEEEEEEAGPAPTTDEKEESHPDAEAEDELEEWMNESIEDGPYEAPFDESDE